MAHHCIGIDLGTTNSALAFVRLDAEADEAGRVSLFPVTQLDQPGELAQSTLLPSSLYIPGANEFVAGALVLPWNPTPPYIVGRLAQRRGVENANRLVSSAKSWLSSRHISPKEPNLPFAAPDGIPKVSALEASRQYLEHLRHSWEHTHPELPFAAQEVLITVPASFDAAARALTQQAAQLAGYPEVILLEEPQAAFYAWLEANPNWREQVHPGDLLLIVDIGGGTTDFSLIAVTEEGGELRLERVAVGEHILLGGDNMDLALARFVEQQLSQAKTKLDPIQFYGLWQQCRAAKETLLQEDAPGEQALAVAGRGTGLVGGTIRTKLTREDARRVLVDGFFPTVAVDATPEKQRRTALLEGGLPFASDAAVTKHLAQFLRRAGQAAGNRTIAAPTHLLLNGGVLQAGAIEERLVAVLNGWLGSAGAPALRPLAYEHKSSALMHAVARGAAYYGLARAGKGVRIRGGVPRTYYVGIESSMPAVPGVPAPLKALTVVPFGLEEGSRVDLPARKFALVVGEQAEFRFFSSLSRKKDTPGELIDAITPEFEELSPVTVSLPSQATDGALENDEIVPVTIETNVTETGMLELWCVADDGRRWKLEFSVREAA